MRNRSYVQRYTQLRAGACDVYLKFMSGNASKRLSRERRRSYGEITDLYAHVCMCMCVHTREKQQRRQQTRRQARVQRFPRRRRLNLAGFLAPARF